MDKEAMENLLSQLARPTTALADTGVPSVALPPGWRVEQFPGLANSPSKIIDARVFRTTESVIEYAKRFLDQSTTVVFACLGPPSTLQVRFDYHAKGSPRWDQHVATLECRQTRAMDEWCAKNGSWLSHKGFAQHIRDRNEDLRDMDGDGATKRLDIMEIARRLQVAQQIDVSSAHTLSNGSSEMTYSVANQGTAGGKRNVSIPEYFGLALQPFACDETAFALQARFEYQVKNGTLEMRYELLHLEKVVELAFDHICAAVESALKVPLYQSS